MKTKLPIFLFLISLSHFAFGQDSPVVTKDSLKLTSFLNGNYAQPKPSLPQTHILSKQEKDSIYNSCYLLERTQQLLREYEKGTNKDIFLAENHFNFLSVLNSNLVHYKKKRNLLIDRIKNDEKNIKTKNKFILTHSDRISTSNINRQPVSINQSVDLKDETLNQFMKKVNTKEYIDFSYASFLFVEVDYSKEQPIQNLQIPSYKKIENQYQLPSLNKTIRKLKNTRIAEIEYFPNTIAFPLGHATTELIGLIIIYYEK